MVSWYYLVSYLVWYFSWYSIVRHFYGIVTTLVHCHLNYCIIVLIVTNVVFDICMDQTYTVIYRIHQNRSSPWIVTFQSNGLRPNAGQTNPVDLRDMLTSACPRSLSHFLLSISSLALIRGTVILHSSSRFKQTVNRFPSIFLSLPRSHTYTNHFPSVLHTNAFFPSHTFIKQVRVSLQDENGFVRGAFCLERGTCLLQTIKRYCGRLYWLTHTLHTEMINDQIKIHTQSCIEAHQHTFSFPLVPPACYLCWCPVSWVMTALHVISSDKDVSILLRGLLKSYWSLLSLSCY